MGALAERIAKLIENGQLVDELDSVAAENALASLVRAGSACAHGAEVMGWDCAKAYFAALSALAVVLGVEGE